MTPKSKGLSHRPRDDVDTKHQYRDKESLAEATLRKSPPDALAGNHSGGRGYHRRPRNKAGLDCQQAVAVESQGKRNEQLSNLVFRQLNQAAA